MHGSGLAPRLAPQPGLAMGNTASTAASPKPASQAVADNSTAGNWEQRHTYQTGEMTLACEPVSISSAELLRAAGSVGLLGICDRSSCIVICLLTTQSYEKT